MASLRVEFFGVNRPVLVGASSIEELFDKGEIFVHGLIWAALRSFLEVRAPTSLTSSAASLSLSSLWKTLPAAFFTSARSSVPSLSLSMAAIAENAGERRLLFRPGLGLAPRYVGLWVVGASIPALVEVDPSGMRELHWHPNTSEWQYTSTARLVFCHKHLNPADRQS